MTGDPLTSPRETGHGDGPHRDGQHTDGRHADGRHRDDLPVGGDALAPVRAALIGEATQRADELRASATAEAEAVLADARRQVEEILAQACARGESDGQSAAAARAATSRRDARSVVLTAQCRTYDELRRRVRDAVGALREDPVYPRLLGRLEDLARSIAGPSAAISRHPSGGVLAQGAGTFVDCSLPRLADTAVDALGSEVSALWSG